MPGGHPYLLAVGPHILADPHLTGFALARASPKLFFGALYSKLLLLAAAFSAAQIFFSVLAKVLFCLLALRLDPCMPPLLVARASALRSLLRLFLSVPIGEQGKTTSAYRYRSA